MFPIYQEDFVSKQVHLPVLLLYAADHTLYHSIGNTLITLRPQSQSILQDLPDYEIIKNTYRTLMTRGMKGCYVYCTDTALAEYLKKLLKQK